MAAYCQVYGVIHFTSPAGWLPVHRDQLRAQRSVTSMGKLYFFIGQWKRLGRVMVECTCLLHITSNYTSKFMTLIWSGLVVQVVSALLRGSWQDFNWHDASRGPLAIAELLVGIPDPDLPIHYTTFLGSDDDWGSFTLERSNVKAVFGRKKF